MAIYQLGELTPDIADSAWVADSAQVIGRVTLAEDSSVWFNAVLRGDTEALTIGRGTNIQDGSVLHADHGFPLVLGEGVTVGHQAPPSLAFSSPGRMYSAPSQGDRKSKVRNSWSA